MSQSVNVLSCLCSNCPDCSGDSQDDDKKPINCALCCMSTCEICKAERTGNILLKQSVVSVNIQEMMLEDDVLSCHFNLLKHYPCLNGTFLACYSQLKHERFQGKISSVNNRIGCKFETPEKVIKITICYVICLSEHGEGLYLTVKSCESSDTNRNFEFTFNEGQTAIDIPIISPQVMINIYESYEDFN